MWNQYRKSFAFIQVCIAITAYLVHQQTGYRMGMTAVFVAVMELSAVVGAWWAARLKSRILAAQTPVPLYRRRRSPA